MNSLSEQEVVSYRRANDMIARNIGGDMLLVPVRKGSNLESVYTLDEVGAFIWNRLDGQQTLFQIAQAISTEYEVDVDTAGKDLLLFIQKMESFGAVVKL